ncbi:ribonucleoside diphosphage reductase 1, beta subunit, B2 [Escherichia coli TA206]|nr:ribonucleoside diphosphage reductase 1, beta subunit, B2 [Escherichia coli TA206]
MRRERLIRPTKKCRNLGLIRRASVASGNQCRMRRERLIRPTKENAETVRPDKTRKRRIRQTAPDAA